MSKIKIVAEIGCNHNGNKELARKMVDEAVECGVDAVKFQTFKADALISCYAPKAEYQIENTGEEENQLEMTRKLELPYEDYLELKQYVEAKGIEVFSTAFDMESIDFLAAQKQNVWKIPSGEINNLPYLEKIRDLSVENKQIVLSTGMALMDEIRQAVDILQKNGEQNIVLLHCNTEYPTPDEDVNVSAIWDLKRCFSKCRIGFSDHSVGCVAAVMSVSYGICFIEKHFTLDKQMEGPDHKASATPKELRELVRNVRRAEKILGVHKKIVTDSERKNIVVARKSIVAKQSIQAGEKFTEMNITCKRPGNGITPMSWYEVIGKTAKHSYGRDELLSIDELTSN